MLLSVRDADLLRLLRWCRCIAPADLLSLFSETELLNLVGAGLMKLHTPSQSLLLTTKGQCLLDSIYPPQLRVLPSYRESDICRHIRTAKLVLTAYHAGTDIFHTAIEDLTHGTGLFLPSLTRGRGKNPWGNTRVAAIGFLGGTTYAFHTIYHEAGRMTLADELRAFTANTSGIPGARRLVFCGESYHTILAELDATGLGTKNRLVHYGEAYQRSPLPVHLLSCNTAGAKQLTLISVQDYRDKLTRAALKGAFQPPAPGLDCDAMYDGHPFVMAADLELRRIDTLCRMAEQGICKAPVLAALEEQATALLHSRYRDTGKARVFVLTEGALREALGFVPTPYEPPSAPFLTEKGEMIDAPLIQAPRSLVTSHGKRGSPGGEKARTPL